VAKNSQIPTHRRYVNSFDPSREGGKVYVDADELEWLFAVLHELGDFKTRISRDLQVDIERGEDRHELDPLKDSLTDIIIMGHRLVEKELGFLDLLGKAVSSGRLSRARLGAENLENAAQVLCAAVDNVERKTQHPSRAETTSSE
jgi:hypothetical protein